MDLLHTLRMELGSATLLISHDLGLVAEYCDRAYVMYAGRIVEQAGIEALFATPQHPYTHALLNSTLRSDRRQDMFLTIEGQPPNPAAPPAGCRFHPRCPNMFARCAAVEPPLYALGAGRASRCLLQEPRA
jgi:oligopeptide/dipeptide ABC transporter ATP-binding protein